MNLLKNKERLIGIIIIIVLVVTNYLAVSTLLKNNEVMLIPKEKVENVKACMNNDVACSLIITDKEDIPSQ